MSAVLVLNAGSSSIKFGIYERTSDGAPGLLCRGEVVGIGAAAQVSARDAQGAVVLEHQWSGADSQGTEAILPWLIRWIEQSPFSRDLAWVGHRIVHGGESFAEPVRITEQVLKALDALSPLAPIHQRPSLEPIRILRELRPNLVHVGCFDTAFHRGIRPVARRYGIPRRYEAMGVRKYGFHGISYEYVFAHLGRCAPEIAGGKIIVAHLGSGASLCGAHQGRSIDTTMGFTALDGLLMSTRCGSLDPGVVLYLEQQCHLTATQIEHLLYRESGLQGVSGISGDMQVLLRSRAVAAQEAIDLFVWRIVRETGALMAVLGGVDTLVFTGGIGANSPEIRRGVCSALAWCGVAIDEQANACGKTRLEVPGAPIHVLTFPTDEEVVIAQHVFRVLGG